jgi:hypothetical protein
MRYELSFKEHMATETSHFLGEKSRKCRITTFKIKKWEIFYLQVCEVRAADRAEPGAQTKQLNI